MSKILKSDSDLYLYYYIEKGTGKRFEFHAVVEKNPSNYIYHDDFLSANVYLFQTQGYIKEIRAFHLIEENFILYKRTWSEKDLVPNPKL